MSSRFIRQILAVLLLTAATATPVFASTITYFSGRDNVLYATALEACKSYSQFYKIRGANPTGDGFYCGTDTQTVWTIFRNTRDCPNGHVGLICNVQKPPCDYGTFDPDLNSCPTPPWNNCPPGSSWDFDSERCTYPQDDACGAIGAHWDPAASACQCDSPTSALVTAAGVTRCMALRDDSCTKDSPDFKGYASSGTGAGKAICDGRASCPNGGVPGYVGQGDNLSAICYSDPNKDSPDCNGTLGVMNGERVCVPDPGKDPDFPDCSGVVGTINGVKQCIHKPTNHPGCKPGETAGYVGRGANQQFTCVPADYKPDTCPPGQYVTNAATGGFGCAKADGQSKPDKDAGKQPGKTSGTAITDKKDADGNPAGSEETELELDFSQLLQDTPNTDFKKELDAFSDSTLESVDTDSLIKEFAGSDGAFTERNSLNNLGSFLKSHTIGNSTNCSGTLPFFGRVITCDKFATYNRIIGWMIFIYTLIHIYNVIMRKSESGV